MNKKIILADSSLYSRSVLKEILIQASCGVITEISTVKDLLKEIEMSSPDLVILDLLLPELNLTKTIEAIRQNLPSVKIVLTSILGQQELVIEGIKAGAAEFLIKPFQSEEVLNILKECLCNKQ